MHPYATDSKERVRVIAMLVVLSMLVSQVIAPLVHFPDWTIWFFDLSAVGWFFVFFWITDRFLWKAPILHGPWLFEVPNLNGTWCGELRSSHDKFTEPMLCELIIEQTWTEMCVKFKAERQGSSSSTSVSKVSSLLLDQDGETVLRYEYHNTPDSERRDALDIHWGTTRVVISTVLATPVLQGTYYTNRRPQTHGKSSLRRT
jgi:hypothetical protein